MSILFNPLRVHRAMREAGVIGINARNLDYVYAYNKRRLYPIVDDKITTKAVAIEAGVRVPEQYAVLEFPADFAVLRKVAAERRQFVLKPARGAGGGGILVISGLSQMGLRKASGHIVAWEDVRYHVNNIYSGMYSLGSGTDRVLVEQLLKPHSAFEELAFRGVPDVRVIVFRGVPAIAMLRLPTSMSDGKANLHQGGVGAGVDLATGLTSHAVCFNRPIERHPDFETPLTGFEVPHWPEVLELAARLGSAVGLGYVGVDLVIDETFGPVMLELNARPGISIQIAHNEGLGNKLRRIHELETIPDDPKERVKLAIQFWGERHTWRPAKPLSRRDRKAATGKPEEPDAPVDAAT